MKYPIFLFTILFFTSCQKTATGPLEIYRVNQAPPDIRKNEHHTKDCFYCYDLAKDKLNEKALLEEKDIAHFDWTNQQVTLSPSGKEKLNKVHISTKGLAVAFVLNGEPIYGFWFWTKNASSGCDRVYTYPRSDFKLGFGLPKGFEYGEDPRFNKLLETYVTNKWKQ